MFDDHIITKTLIMDAVEHQSIQVHYCHTINEADAAWQEHGDKIDTIILDLMMSSFGLPNELRNRTEDDYITGWIWLCSQKHFETVYINKRIIIYSAYLSYLREYIIRPETPTQEQALFRQAVILNKGSIVDVNTLREIILK